MRIFGIVGNVFLNVENWFCLLDVVCYWFRKGNVVENCMMGKLCNVGKLLEGKLGVFVGKLSLLGGVVVEVVWWWDVEEEGEWMGW